MPKPTTSTLDLAIGSRIRARRRELGQTQTELAEVIGLTFQQVQKYERGVNRVSVATLVRIAENQQVGLDYYVGADAAWSKGGAETPAMKWLASIEAHEFAALMGALDNRAQTSVLKVATQVAAIVAYHADERSLSPQGRRGPEATVEVVDAEHVADVMRAGGLKVDVIEGQAHG